MGIGFAVIGFGVLLGIGSVVLYTLAQTSALCATDYTYNASADVCQNASGGDQSTPVSTAYVNTKYVLTQFGTGGLAGWLPTVIAATIGIGLLLVFAGRSGKGRY